MADILTAKNIKPSETPWQISAQHITYNRETNIYTATGDVKIYKDEKTLSAESVIFNHNTMEAASKGNVLLTVGGDTLSGDKININLDTGIGAIYNGQIFIEKKHFFIKGDKILKTGKDTYTINKGSLTACDGETPAWKITGKDLNITLEGYGSVKHAALWAKKIPIFYAPYLTFPVKLKRQSGLLPPRIGYSDRNGIEFIQPYFWAINQSSDATFYYHHIQERGEKLGLEYRYTLSRQSKGTLMVDSLNDRQIDDGTENSSKDWGYTDDKYLRKNSDRYWCRARLDQALFYDFKAKLDIDIVSDQDYLREFSDGYTGYDRTNDYFDSEFGRDLDDDDDPVRENSLTLSKSWSQYSFNAKVQWYDDVIKRRQGGTDKTLQQLPSLMFNALKQPLINGPFFINMDSEYINFYRKDGDTGQRMDIHPRIYLPLRFHNYFTFEPSAGFRQTAWYENPESSDSTARNGNDYQHREIYDLKADLSTDLFNVFDMQGETVDKIKHTITPRLEYNYIPDLDQTKYPSFDNIDRIDPENLMTFSITNLLISKTSKDEPIDNDGITRNIKGKSDSNTYNQFFRFKIEQSYDFNKENKPDEKPFLPLYAELDLTPADLITIHEEAEWSHDHGHFISHNIYCRLRDNRNDHLLIEHRYTRDDVQSIYLDFNRVITQSISIFGNYERNLDSDKDIEKSIGCLYQAQCWSIALSFKDEDDDRKIAGMITLYGLGGMGNRLK
ncbi:MAG: LPS-assembly protein LptD [Dissulfuribacterales bacterium]